MSKKITIRDVAAKANVSIGTVDRVLHNRGNVSPEKFKAVNDAIKELDYRPSKVAQTLALQKRKIKIGIIYPELPKVEKCFWNNVKKGILKAENELGHFGVEIIIKTTKAYNVEEQINAIHWLKNQNVNGIVLIPFHASKLNMEIDELSTEEIPVVTFISDSPKSKRICSVGVDDFNGGRIAGKLMELYLKGKGNVAIIGIHRVILCIQQRVSGFVEKIETECPNINIVEILDVRELNGIDNRSFHDEVYNIACNIIRKTPDLDGIYVTNSSVSWVGNAVKDLGKQGKIKIIGHEHSQKISEQLENDIINASVCQDPKTEIYLCIRYLYEYIVKKKLPKSKIVNTRLEILVKENNCLNDCNPLQEL